MRHTLYAVPVVIGSLLAGGVYYKTTNDYADALQKYRDAKATEASIAARKMESALQLIYQNLRTISLLPGVRKINEDGSNLDGDALQAVQQIYNNLTANVAMSEVYIVQKEIDIESSNPLNKQPIKMFDTLMMDPTNPPAEGPGSPYSEDEDAEYVQFKKTAAYMQQTYPTSHNLDPLTLPVLAGEPVVTCDNSDYDATKNDIDRTGVMFSVPFFGMDKNLRGMISGIIRLNALKDLLPPSNYALVHTGYGIALNSKEEGQQEASAAAVKAGKPDESLIYSSASDLNLNDPNGKWVLWAGMPDTLFTQSADVKNIRLFGYAGYTFALLLTALGLWLVRRQQHFGRMASATRLFEGSVTDMVAHLVSSVGQMKRSADRVAAIAGETQTRSGVVVEASNEAAESSSQMAAAAEELSASLLQVNEQTQQSRQIFIDASGKANAAKEAMGKLSAQSGKVSEIVELISGVAGQINLLALNASIEAARAGDAGRGFAVVADEVKKLATQVSSAAEEITSQVKGIQAATDESVVVVEDILGTIHLVTEKIHHVATAVQEQSTATNDIVRNVGITAEGARKISGSIKDVQQDADQTSTLVGDVLSGATSLDDLARNLQQDVDKFLRSIR